MDTRNYVRSLLKTEEITPEEAKKLNFGILPFDDTIGEYTYLDSLKSIGFLTEDEAKAFEEFPVDLPTDRKSLIACYVLFSKAVNYNEVVGGDFLSSMKQELRKRGLPEYVEGNASFASIIGNEEAYSLFKSWQDNLVRSIKAIVTDFVCVKRRRLRDAIKPFLLLYMSYALVYGKEKDENGEFTDRVGYLRSMMKEGGYREDAKSLSNEEKTMFEGMAEDILTIMEECYLNGTAERRFAKYKPLRYDNGAFKEAYSYEDEIDEILLEYENIYYLFEATFNENLRGNLTCKREYGYGECVKGAMIDIFDLWNTEIQGVLKTKFKDYAVILLEDEQIKENLSPEALETIKGK